MSAGASFVLAAAAAALCPRAAAAQATDPPGEAQWVTVTAASAGTDPRGRDDAVAEALRKAVEQACGTFLKARSRTENYKLVYDRIFADAVGYVRRHTVVRIRTEEGETHATVKALVSTEKFSKDWAAIAHTVRRAGNPRLLVALRESIGRRTAAPVPARWRPGVVQSRIEEFLLDHDIVLVDRKTAGKVSRRDVVLAAAKDDAAAVAAFGAKLKADVVLTGHARAQFSKAVRVGEATMYQYTTSLTVKAVQSDSARILLSKTYGPETQTLLQRHAEEKALAKTGRKVAPKVLSDLVEAWRKQVQVSKAFQLVLSPMTYRRWKRFREEISELRGVEDVRLREITESVASIELEYRYGRKSLADHLTSLKKVRLEITELTASRIKAKVIE